jgi:hypothetical protein
MRSIVLTVCVMAAGCSSRALESSTAPSAVSVAGTSAEVAPASTQASRGAELPFSGTLAGTTSAIVTPPTLEIDLLGVGQATQLGRFTTRSAHFGVLGVPASTGTWDFTAANGDELFTTVTTTVEPGPAGGIGTSIATIVGGTGRFAGATGTFVVVFLDVHDEATATGQFSGTFEGHITLSK